jgi:hypothetical protein
MKNRKRFSRQERISQIVYVLSRLERIEGKGGLTSYQIALWVNMSPGGHLSSILWSATRSGVISYKKTLHRPGVDKRLWYVTEKGREWLKNEKNDE